MEVEGTVRGGGGGVWKGSQSISIPDSRSANSSTLQKGHGNRVRQSLRNGILTFSLIEIFSCHY